MVELLVTLSVGWMVEKTVGQWVGLWDLLVRMMVGKLEKLMVEL